MGGTGQSYDSTHVIFVGDVSKVHESFRVSQNSGMLKKIVMVIPDDRQREFKHLRTEISKYCTEVVVEGVNISDVAGCALAVYDFVTAEKKQGHVITINITDSSIFTFTVAAGIVGSITKSRVITTTGNDIPVDVPLVPYCRIATKRYEILKALGDSGADNTESLKTKLKKLFKTEGIEDSNLSTQLRILEERGFIVREKNRQSKTIRRTLLGRLIQKAYEDYPSSRTTK
jgi:DNA-binding transcriptional ArsR family regulator